MSRSLKQDYSPHDRLWIALSKQPFVEDEVLTEVKSALADGADPDLAMREFQDFRYATGLAAAHLSLPLVDMLLEAGASLHWPGEETDIDALELCGEEDVGYAGESVDPLTLLTGRLAWDLGSPRENDPQTSNQKITSADRMIRHLMDKGADPQRSDPAIGRTPFDHLLIEFTESGGTTTELIVKQTLGDLMFDVAVKVEPEAASHILKGNWKILPFWQWEWQEDFPELSAYIIERAQRAQLAKDTPQATSHRTVRL